MTDDLDIDAIRTDAEAQPDYPAGQDTVLDLCDEVERLRARLQRAEELVLRKWDYGTGWPILEGDWRAALAEPAAGDAALEDQPTAGDEGTTR